MAPVESCLIMFASFASSSLAVEAQDVQALLMDDECAADATCALGLLQLSQQRVPKHSHASLVSRSTKTTDARSLQETAATMSDGLNSQTELYEMFDGRPYPEIDDGVWSFDIPRPVKVTTWSGQFWMAEGIVPHYAPNCQYQELSHGEEDITFFPPSLPGHKACCDWEYVIKDPEYDISDFDVVLFYLPYIMRTNWTTSMPRHKKEGQLWIATCGEPMYREETFMDCRLANDTEFMKNIDGFASYSGTSDFPAYFDTPSEEQMRLDPPNFAERGEELVTMALSDCYNTERNEYMEAFLKQFEAKGQSNAVLSYGKCMHNAKEPKKNSCGEPGYQDPWANRCSSRPFKVVAENSFDSWYISEKLWDAFFEGAIPIYYGPEEAKRLTPPHSVVFASDYDTPEALADAIMAFTEADFTKARAWKTTPKSEWNDWATARRNGHATLLPRLCEAGARAQEVVDPSLVQKSI